MKTLTVAAVAVAGLILAAVAGVARAEVTDRSAAGFSVRESVLIAAPPRKVWASLIQPALWWSPDHTYSHDAHNLSLDTGPGGEWRERLPSGGFVRHLAVVYADPPAVLRLEGALGPLQAWGVAGHLTFTLKAEGQGTRLQATYDAGGHEPGGLDGIVDPVDRVLGEQVARLKARVETGRTP